MTPKVVKYNGLKAPKVLVPKALAAPRQGLLFGKTAAKSAPPLKNAITKENFLSPQGLTASPADTASPDVMTKKKKLQAKLKKMIKGAPKRAVTLGKNLAHNAAPVMAMAGQGVKGALQKGANVVRRAVDNYQLAKEEQQRQLQQMMTANTTEGLSISPTTFTTTTITPTPTTTTTTITTDDETDDEDVIDNEQLLANELIAANMIEFGKVNEAKGNLNIAPNANELIDTREVALAYSDWRVENSCRSGCVWFLMLLNLILLLSLICDVSIYTGVMRLLYPFGHILNSEKTKTECNEEEEGNERYRTKVVIAAMLSLVFASLRIFLLLKVMEMEDADYQTKPSSVPCSFFQFFTLIMIAFWIFITISISSNLDDTVKNFEQIFKSKMEVYANFSSQHTMIEMDKLQQTFRCCGASGFNSWFKLDLYKFLRENQSEYVTLYWERFKECHSIGGVTLDIFKRRHSTEEKESERINSVPFSCCSPDSESLCMFYNHNNRFPYWEKSYEHTLYNASCMDTVKPKLMTLGLKIESLYFYRLLLEVAMFLVMCVVQSSFDSYHENHHRPSIATLPLCWALFAIIGLTYFYCNLKFFLWKYSFKVFLGLDSSKLVDLATSLQTLGNTTSNSTDPKQG